MDLALDAAKKPTRRLARVLAPLADDYDYVFLDCPPSISLVSESVFEAADALLVPLIPATLSSRTFEQLRDVVARPRDDAPQVLAFFSMVDGRKRLHREVMENLPAEHDTVLQTAIPAASDVERMGVHRTASPTSRPAAAPPRVPRALARGARTPGGGPRVDRRATGRTRHRGEASRTLVRRQLPLRPGGFPTANKAPAPSPSPSC